MEEDPDLFCKMDGGRKQDEERIAILLIALESGYGKVKSVGICHRIDGVAVAVITSSFPSHQMCRGASIRNNVNPQQLEPLPCTTE